MVNGYATATTFYRSLISSELLLEAGESMADSIVSIRRRIRIRLTGPG